MRETGSGGGARGGGGAGGGGGAEAAARGGAGGAEAAARGGPGWDGTAGGGAADGRYIDPTLGTLLGEGSEQRIAPPPPAGGPGPASHPAAPWSELPADAFAGETPSYYGRPLLKQPVWIWSIPLYFYVGGTAGVAAVLGAAVQLAGGPDTRTLVRRCRQVAAAGSIVSAGLLIHDLGRPARFLNMMRVFRPTSAMSVGSWVLAGAGGATMGSALLAGARGWLGRLGDLAGLAGALFGAPLAGYTSVLLANTPVPIWKETRRTLPPLFVASAASGAASLFGLMPLNPREEHIVHRFGGAAKVADLAAMAAVESAAGRVEQVGQPLRQGLSGSLWKGAKALTAASLLLTLLPTPRRRPGLARAQRVATGLLGTGGAIALRFAVFHAGKASAADPQATFSQQRAAQPPRD